MNGGSVSDVNDLCFYQLADYDILNNDTFMYMKGNVAPITGYEVCAGTVKDCINLLTLSTSKEQITKAKLTSIPHKIFVHVLHLEFLNIFLSSWYQVSSQPLKICFCYPGPQLMHVATVVESISVYPGQTFKIMAVGVGVGISPAVVRSKISGKYDIFPKLQSLGNACESLNYTIFAPENISGILVQLTVKGSHSRSHLKK